MALGLLLRSVRRQHGLTLRDVQERSGGRWKGVVIGSYERGDRSVTVQGLAELADLYGVPVASLVPDLGMASLQHNDPGLVLDLGALRALDDPEAAPLQRYVDALMTQRSAPGGAKGLTPSPCASRT